MARTTVEWTVVPSTPAQIEAAARQSRRLVTRRAALAAGVAALPVPGLDLLTDVGLLMKVIPEINTHFGLSADQIERLAPDRQLVVYKVLSASGGVLVGKIVTQDLLMRLLRTLGVRLTAQQAAKYVSVAGQVVSAALTFGALKMVCELHIQQCIDVARQLQLPAPDITVQTVQ
jgi:uncharacterized protein (DUF697 family)